MADRAKQRRKSKGRTLTDHDCVGAAHDTLKDHRSIPGRLFVDGQWWCQTCVPRTGSAACTHTSQAGNGTCAWCGGPTSVVGAPKAAVVDLDAVDAERVLLALAVYSSDAYQAGRMAAAAMTSTAPASGCSTVYARPELGWPVGSTLARSILASPARWSWPTEVQEWLADRTSQDVYEPEPALVDGEEEDDD